VPTNKLARFSLLQDASYNHKNKKGVDKSTPFITSNKESNFE